MKFEGSVLTGALDIRSSVTKGYHITARIPIPEGTTIIKVIPPPTHRPRTNTEQTETGRQNNSIHTVITQISITAPDIPSASLSSLINTEICRRVHGRPALPPEHWHYNAGAALQYYLLKHAQRLSAAKGVVQQDGILSSANQNYIIRRYCQKECNAILIHGHRCECAHYCCQSHRTADAEEHSASGECTLLQSSAARCLACVCVILIQHLTFCHYLSESWYVVIYVICHNLRHCY